MPPSSPISQSKAAVTASWQLEDDGLEEERENERKYVKGGERNSNKFAGPAVARVAKGGSRSASRSGSPNSRSRTPSKNHTRPRRSQTCPSLPRPLPPIKDSPIFNPQSDGELSLREGSHEVNAKLLAERVTMALQGGLPLHRQVGGSEPLMTNWPMGGSGLNGHKALGDLFAESGRRRLSDAVIEEQPVVPALCLNCNPLRETVDSLPLTTSPQGGDTLPNFKEKGGFKSLFFYKANKKKGETTQPPPACNSSSNFSSAETLLPTKDSEAVVLQAMEQVVYQAYEQRDAALYQVEQLKIAMNEMGKKIGSLESGYESLKQSLNGGGASLDQELHAFSPDNSLHQTRFETVVLPRGYVKSSNNNSQSNISSPSIKEFRRALVETRFFVKELCQSIIERIQETQRKSGSKSKMDSILSSHNVRIVPRVSRSVRYHLESLVNEVLYQDFENVRFQPAGTYYILDPNLRCHAFYQSFLSLSKVGCKEALSKDSIHYSESFERFCESKLSATRMAMGLREEEEEDDNDKKEEKEEESVWSKEVSSAFFEAARGVWLVHLLAFAFDPPAAIFRIGKEADFDPKYMEEVSMDQEQQKKKNSQATSTSIRAMVMPGFFVHDEIVKCKVLCRQSQPQHHV